jgi:hypothetical protein
MANPVIGFGTNKHIQSERQLAKKFVNADAKECQSLGHDKHV